MEAMGPAERKQSRIIPPAAFPSASRKMNEKLQSQLLHLDTALKRVKEGLFFSSCPRQSSVPIPKGCWRSWGPGAAPQYPLD